ncbi:MAG: FAD-dependent oxidoreductase, partial [Firmicutes bacterium]|nr:FAD-dependent oxidoreductase [Bacillota bacterium]
MAAALQVNAEKMYDVIVVGGGPAGLTAALYLARARYRVLVIEKDHFGGQITITDEVVNYPGVFKTSGKALSATMIDQAKAFGAELLLAEVESMELSGEIKTVRTTRGEYQCFGVLLATGAHPRTVGFKGEEEYKGRGVAYCATCDGEFFTGKDIFVIGGGYAAAEESVFLTKFAKSVTIMMRGDDFSCAESVAEHARHHEKISILCNTVVEEVAGENGLNYIRYKNTKSGEVTEFRAAAGDSFGVFVFAGYRPATALVKDLGVLNEQGYVITDANQQTAIEGFYAAGDVCIKPLRQVVTAVGDGALAATELEKYAARLQKQTGIVPAAPRPQAQPQPAPQAAPAAAPQQESALFDAAMQAQLQPVFQRMAQPLQLQLHLDERPVSRELQGYMEALAELTNKLSVQVVDRSGAEGAPMVRVCLADGSYTGLAFHGVPGGHEFTSFVLGLYNAAGPGQAVDAEVLAEIQAIDRPIDIKVLISLSCTMCPELVTAAQRIAAANPLISAEVYDINHFGALKDKFKVMSVPCLVVDDRRISFGKKNIRQLVDFLQ